MDNKKIKSFTDLTAWSEAHGLVLFIYKSTRNFPVEERFGLTSQIQRAAVSISSNIAEGFSRNSQMEKRQFYYHALGSLTEVQNQLLIARDLGYLSKIEFKRGADQTIIISKLVNGLIKSVNRSQLNT